MLSDSSSRTRKSSLRYGADVADHSISNEKAPNIVSNHPYDVLTYIIILTTQALSLAQLLFDRTRVQTNIQYLHAIFLFYLLHGHTFRALAHHSSLLSPQQTSKVAFQFDESQVCATHNIMDKWILAYTQTLIKFVHQEMKGMSVTCEVGVGRDAACH